jgi:hypothetical protein
MTSAVLVSSIFLSLKAKNTEKLCSELENMVSSELNILEEMKTRKMQRESPTTFLHTLTSQMEILK